MTTIEILQKKAAALAAEIEKINNQVSEAQKAEESKREQSIIKANEHATELIGYIHSLKDSQLTEKEFLTNIRHWCFEKLPMDIPTAKGSKVKGENGTTLPRVKTTGPSAYKVLKEYMEGKVSITMEAAKTMLTEKGFDKAQVRQGIYDATYISPKYKGAFLTKEGDMLKKITGPAPKK